MDRRGQVETGAHRCDSPAEKFDDLSDKKDKVIHLFGDLADLGKGLDKLQQSQGSSGGGNIGSTGGGGSQTGTTGGSTGGGGSQTGILSPELQSDLTKITDGLSDQCVQIETLTKAAAHTPYDQNRGTFI